ncbi:MAG: TonB-dependent receptor family protein [Tannerellaceae bacterium]|jgi:hypothetical protein|nr:TonB-dependent receptor family protein [Tannerellaceae bacterium]
MRSILLFVFFAWQIINIANAQNIQIKGTVNMQDGTVAELANVVLQTVDSAFVAGTTTDLEGNFRLSQIQAGDYRIIISSVGYRNSVTELMGIVRSLDLGTLILQEDSELLGEVTVTASSIVNQSDRKIIFPTEQQVKSSTNAIGLLQNMMLARIEVNQLTNTVEMMGQGNLQLRVNGVEVTNGDLMALQPQDIIRIEYIENPGLRYGNADAVLNYITRRHESGGSVSMDVMQSPHIMYAQDYVSAKFNHKKSEFGLRYEFWGRDFFEYWRTNEEVFRFEDEREVHRYEDGKPGRVNEIGHNASLNYNYQEPDKYYFNATMRMYVYEVPHIDFRSDIYTVDRPDHVIAMSDLTDQRTYRPALDLYYQRQLKNKQSLVFNLVGTYNRTKEERTYNEFWNDTPLTEVRSNVRGNKKSIIGEAIYEKEFETGRLSAGGKHTQAIADNKYMGTNASTTKMKQSDSYVYTEYQGKWNKLTYSLGVGLSRSWFKQDGHKDYETYLFRPRFSLHHRFSDRFYVRTIGELSNVDPTLSELSAVTLLVDSLLLQRGNPELSPYKRYKLDFDTEYRLGKLSLTGNFTYMNRPNAVMETTYRENNLFIRTFENHKRMQTIWSSVTLRSNPLWNIFMFSLTGGVNHYISDGNTYQHKYTNWFYRAQMMAMYKRWIGVFEMQSRWNNFYGETLTGGENMHNLMVAYNYKNVQVGLVVINPFVDNYKRINENWNQYASYKRSNYCNESSQAFILKFAWNFNFGRKYDSAQKKLDNADTDTGIINAGK